MRIEMSFVFPEVRLERSSSTTIRTLPELVEFHVKHNPQHLFCFQAEKKANGDGTYDFVPVTYEKLRNAILQCQVWLTEHVPGFHLPAVSEDGSVKKCPPVAILMESHFALAVYVLALMGMGVPCVLLSARLSPLAVAHLIRATGAKSAIVSQRLHPVISEAFSTSNEIQNGFNEVDIAIAPGYELFLQAEAVANDGRVAFPHHYVSEDDRQALILHSSGTSGLPKPIYCAHRHFLGFAACHNFSSDAEAHGLTISTSPFFHGFGIVPMCLSLGIGKTICIPPPTVIPTGASVAALLAESGAKALMTVPSIIEELALLPEDKGVEILQKLDFVTFGGGIPKASVGEKLESAGVRLINHYGATETGPMTPFFVPAKGHDWHYLKLREDTLKPLEVKLDLVDAEAKTYKMSMRPFGWNERFELQDLLVASPAAPEGSMEFSILGRTDDLICLATGEKVRPTILESLLRQHDKVKAATAFGDNRFELGVIVETTEPLDPDQVKAFKESIWPTIEKAGTEMDAHAKISSPAAVLVFPPDTLPRSDKGTILRLEVAKKFAKEIDEVYQNIEANVVAPRLDLSDPASTIRSLIIDNIEWRVPLADWEDGDDFFELGMDSLQAARLRRLLSASLKATTITDAEKALKVQDIPEDFVYRNSSVRKVVEALTGEHRMVNGISESDIVTELADKYSGRTEPQQQKATVLITGGSGSLGSYFVSKLMDDPSVGRIVCLNRRGKDDPIEKQKNALKSRGITISEDAWSKVEVHATSTSAQHLGLDGKLYQRLASEVTHIAHIAWPMSFKMSLQSFDASFKTVQNLIKLASEAHSRNPQKRPRMLFISSISTVGNYLSVTGERLVPEIPVANQDWSLSLGYAKAKLVCEMVIQNAATDHPEIEVGLIRVGQMAGSRTGYWNADEHFVALVGSAQKLGKFPDLRGVSS
jgi:acyl-CoA synthetase (AMP-forming)/AMP-acid ligase II/NAD(P)-dependent dehydrogenase (short-subunit alcohol dehydrogenase family)